MHNVQTCKSVSAFLADKYDLDEFSARGNIEFSIDWFDLLQNTVYPGDHGIRYYFVAERQRSVTIMPVRLTTRGRVRTVESLTNYYTSLFTPLLGNDAERSAPHLKHMLAAATRDHQGAHVMRFAPMDPELPAYQKLMDDLRAIGWIPFRFYSFGNWFLKVGFDWKGYLQKRSSNLRSTISRMNKKSPQKVGDSKSYQPPKQPCLKSSRFRMPRGVVFDHGIHDGEQFPHTSDDHNLAGFAG